MQNAYRFLGALLIILSPFACTEELSEPGNLIDEPIVVADLEIEYNYICGWGLRKDTFRIADGYVEFIQNVNGSTGQDTMIDTVFPVPIAWLDSLYNNLDMNQFQQLNYNSMNIAVDGCDAELIISKDQVQHSVRYGYGDTLFGMKPFMNQLDSLWMEIGVLAPGEG